MNQESEDEKDTSLLGKPMDEALEWFTRLRDPQISSDERRNFQLWLNASEENSTAYRKVEQFWTSPALTEAARAQSDASIPLKPVSQWRNSLFMLTKGRIIAMATILVMGLSLWLYSDKLILLRADHYTMAGKQQTVTLADGSVILLNTDSALTVDYQPAQRLVRLLKGEAYFDVNPDTNRPFEVVTKAGKVSVVGTRFSIRSGPQETITVLSGTVVYSQPKNTHPPALITRGQRIKASSAGIGQLQAVDTRNSLAWMRGRLIFRNQQLNEAISEVDRYLPGRVFITDPRLASTRVTGNYKLQDPRAIIRALAQSTGAEITQLSPYLTLLH